MPAKLERALQQKALALAKEGKLHKRKGESTKEAMAAYVYGTLRKTGWKPKGEK